MKKTSHHLSKTKAGFMKKIEVFPNLLSVSKPFKGIILDMYGVFWGGNSVGLLPNAKETMKSLIDMGKEVAILSNSTQMREHAIEKMKTFGLIQGEHFHHLLTSGDVAKELLLKDELPFKTPKKKFFLFGEVHPKYSSHVKIFEKTSFLETKDVSEADFIFISIPNIKGEDQLDAALFFQEVKKLKNSKVPMFCINPDLVAHEGNPIKAVIRQGSIARMYEEIGGKVFYVGKPSPLIFSKAMDFYNNKFIAPKEILMVGDTPETDIRGARSYEMASALVVNTGIMGDRTMQYGMDAIYKLPSEDAPDFFIERF